MINAGSNKRSSSRSSSKDQGVGYSRVIKDRLDVLEIRTAKVAEGLFQIIRLMNDPTIPEPVIDFGDTSTLIKEQNSADITALTSENNSPVRAFDASFPLTPPELLKKHVSYQGRNTSHGSTPKIEFKKQFSTPAKFSEDSHTIDIAILYSSPLVELIEKKMMNYEVLLSNDQFNFGEDVFDFLRILNRSKKELKINVGCVSLDQFLKVTKKQPKILHLVCHTGWQLDQKKFCLYFENTKLELLRVTPQTLEKTIATNLSRIDLVILSAPYSDVFAKTFLKLKVKTVIVINNKHRIDGDNLSRWFCREFYQQILQGKTIQEAFDFSLANISEKRKTTCNVCCCYHSHKKNCRWREILLNTGLSSAHAAHQYFCTCVFKNSGIHDIDCEETSRALGKYNQKAAIIENELESDKETTWYPTDHRICCCRPELAHDLTLKIKIYHLQHHKGYGDQAPFLHYKSGNPSFENNQAFKKPIFKEVISIGMEKVLHHLYNSIVFNRRRVIMLFGPSGSGKSSLAKKISNLLYERKAVAEVKHVNMEKINNLNVFLSRISKKASFITHQHYLENITQNSNDFVVLENINYLLETNSRGFISMLNSIIENTRLRFLIVCTFKEELLNKFDTDASQSLHCVEEIVHMPSMSCMKAARLLQVLTNGAIVKKNFSLLDLQAHDILKVKPNEKLLPKKIFDIAFLYRKGKTLQEIEGILSQHDTYTTGLDTHDETIQQKVSLVK